LDPDLGDPVLRRIVGRVAALNLGYFGIEFAVALAIGSVSLFADSVDFLESAPVRSLLQIADAVSASRGEREAQTHETRPD
jgi:Co/Zn/Cd efflux system component